MPTSAAAGERFPITDPTRPPKAKGFGIEPDAPLALGSPTLLYVNFDGPMMHGGCGDDSHNDCSTIIQGQMMEFPGDESARAAVVQAVRADTADFGIITVSERPPESNPYAMVVVGEPAFDVGQVGGIAPSIDCGNSDPNETSFAFLVDSGSNTIATVINQEAAHTWGLEHVDDDLDNLYPTAGGTTDPTYRDVCSQIVSDTDLNPSFGVCNQIHSMFCGNSQQNSYQELLLVFGPTVPDTVAPSVSIDEPTEGAQFAYQDDWNLVLTLDDDRKPQVLTTTIYFDDVAAVEDSKFLDATLDFPIKGGDAPTGHGLGNGTHTIRVEIVDESGNEASAERSFVIVDAPASADTTGGGSEGGSSGGSDGTEEGGTGDDGGSTGGPAATGGSGEDSGCACTSGAAGPGGSAFA
ncbi:MAG: retroviral-like aspartic protease family protein, partial [Nannocystaceae bacterium]|nr:retroviral-like aspartic protease family protein [Nannocystaceae bacterium]